MKGMSTTGKHLSGIAHLRQSVADILSTPVGSRVMRRDYGSRLFELIDSPLNRETLTDLYVATADALDKWEPRIVVKSVKASSATPGRVVLDIVATYLPEGRQIHLDGIVIE